MPDTIDRVFDLSRQRMVCQLCTEEQLHRPEFRAWAKAIKEVVRPHRKIWEWCYIAEALHQRGKLRPGMRGLGFAVGREPLTALFASRGCRVVATDLGADSQVAADWSATNQHATDLAHLNDRGLCPPAEFARRVQFRPVDMNAIPPDLTGFDFVWSSCSIEHLGSIELGKQFMANMLACLNPGGVAVHTTELNLTSDEHTVEQGGSVIFRRRDIADIRARVSAAGGTLLELDYDTGDSGNDGYVDVPPYGGGSAHLKLELAGYVTTSFGLIVIKR